MNFVFLFRTQLTWTSLEFGVWPSLVWSILMTVSAIEERNGPFSEWKLLINKLTVYSFNHFSKVSTAAAASFQSCPTLCDPIDGSPPGFPSLGFSRQEHWSGLPFPSPVHESESEVAQSCPTLATPWTATHQAPPSMGFSRQKYWSRVPLPSPPKFLSSFQKLCLNHSLGHDTRQKR